MILGKKNLMGREQNIIIKQRMKHLRGDGLKKKKKKETQNKTKWKSSRLHFNSFQCRNSHSSIWLQFVEKFNVFVGNS